MLLTNHTLTGILLGLTIDNPVLLAPSAVASHLVLDMTPHFGYAPVKGGFRKPFFIVWGSLDFAASITVTITACLAWPGRTGHILVGVLGAQAPDLVYIPITVFGEKLIYRIPGYRALIRFLGRIQWYEQPLGIITEIVWASLMLTLLHGRLP